MVTLVERKLVFIASVVALLGRKLKRGYARENDNTTRISFNLTIRVYAFRDKLLIYLWTHPTISFSQGSQAKVIRWSWTVDVPTGPTLMSVELQLPQFRNWAKNEIDFFNDKIIRNEHFRLNNRDHSSHTRHTARLVVSSLRVKSNNLRLCRKSFNCNGIWLNWASWNSFK